LPRLILSTEQPDQVKVVQCTEKLSFSKDTCPILLVFDNTHVINDDIGHIDDFIREHPAVPYHRVIGKNRLIIYIPWLRVSPCPCCLIGKPVQIGKKLP